MYRSVALFLLEHPPIDEIGGTITDVIEKYRFGTMSKKDAIKIMLNQYEPFLKKYAEDNAIIVDLRYRS